MPGLAIILSSAGKEKNTIDLQRMLATMRHEPFYSTGIYCNESLGLYVGWVCHPGSYSDPVSSQDDKADQLLFFYGEHLNGTTASANGSTGHSYLHNLLPLFQQHGWHAVQNLNGWFHGILVDLKRNEATIFNDRYGMQRLYICQDGQTTLYASEAKALLAARPRLRRLDPKGLAEFLSCGCVLENRSLFSGINSLPAATAHSFNGSRKLQQHRYFTPSEWEEQSPLPEPEFDKALQSALSGAVDRCLDRSLPLGMSLTGGYDTRLFMACLQRGGRTLPCYTFGGMYRDCFDVKIARKVAQVCGCDHQVLELGPAFLNSFPGLAEKAVYMSEGCLGATNAYELFLNRLARNVAPVRLTGSYGSEVMRGSRAFKAVRSVPGLIQNDFAPHIDSAVQSFDSLGTGHPISFSVFKQAPWYYYNRLVVEQSQVIIRTPFMDNEFVSLMYRRPKSLNDSRALARRLIARIAAPLADLPTDTGNCSYLRHQWAQFLFKADYCYKSGMPQWLERIHHLMGPLQPEKLLIGRHRFAHFRVWFRNELAPYLREILFDRKTAARPYFNHRFVEQMVRQHTNGERNYTDEIERVLTVELTCRQFIDN